jgi:hypothetical protein
MEFIDIFRNNITRVANEDSTRVWQQEFNHLLSSLKFWLFTFSEKMTAPRFHRCPCHWITISNRWHSMMTGSIYTAGMTNVGNEMKSTILLLKYMQPTIRNSELCTEKLRMHECMNSRMHDCFRHISVIKFMFVVLIWPMISHQMSERIPSHPTEKWPFWVTFCFKRAAHPSICDRRHSYVPRFSVNTRSEG